MSILDDAKRDLQIARSNVARAKQTYTTTVDKLREAELRVQRLEITLIEHAVEQDALAQRRAQGRG